MYIKGNMYDRSIKIKALKKLLLKIFIKIRNAKGKINQNYKIMMKRYLYIRQKGCCAMCGIHDSKIKSKTFAKLYIDHDHKTGIIRELLCPQCNFALGKYENHKKQCEKYLKEYPIRILKIIEECY